MNRDKDILSSIRRLPQKQRKLVTLVAILAFILGVILGSLWTYDNMDRVTVSTGLAGGVDAGLKVPS